MSLKAVIDSYGGISKHDKNFTWSCTTIDFDSGIKWGNNQKIIIDAGMFQGEKNTQEQNTSLSKSLIKSNTLILTHAHTDHIGRVPYLVKKWFKGNIITTSDTLWQAKLQWEDYIKLTMREIEKVKHRNNKLAKSLNDAIQIVKHAKIVQNRIGGHKKMAGSKDFLKGKEEKFLQELQKEYKKIWEFFESNHITVVKNNGSIIFKQDGKIITPSEIQSQLQAINISFDAFEMMAKKEYQHIQALMISRSEDFLSSHNVSTQEDIAWCLETVPKLLYNTSDIDQTLQQTQILQKWETLELYANMPVKTLDDPRVMKLPELVHNGFHTPLEVDSKIKWVLVGKYKTLMREYLETIKTNEERKLEIASLKVELWKIYNQVEWLKLNKKHQLTDEEKEEIRSWEEVLRLHKIHSFQDIENISAHLETLPYTYDDLKGAISLLRAVFIDTNVDTLKKVSLSFYDAGHIEWSVQVVLSATVSQVNQTLNKREKTHTREKNEKEFNFLFSWDLGKRKDPNLSGEPDVAIQTPLDFVQVESTYAWRIHTPKEKSIQKLFKELAEAEGKVIIPVFAMQRTQEILMEFLNEKKQKLEDYKDELWILKKEKKDRQHQLLSEMNEGKKSELQKEIEIFSQRQRSLEWLLFDSRIYVDSPLAESITKGYYEQIQERYFPLSPKWQKEMFQKEVIQFIARGTAEDDTSKMQFEKLYLDENKDKKDVILASGGMLQWWPVLSHLKEMLGNPKAKIVFVWYCPPYTLGGKLKAWEKVVDIDGENYEVNCKIVSIDGFSWHGDEEDILTYASDLPLKKWAIVSFNHGDEKRLPFAKKADQIFESMQKEIRTLVPKLWEKIEISLR